MTSPSLRALKAVTRAMFLPRVAIQEISLPRMNMYMIMALCAAKMIPRGSFRDAPTPALSVCRGYRSEHIYRAKLLWRINNTLRILVNFNDKLRVSTNIRVIFLAVAEQLLLVYGCNAEVIVFRGILSLCYNGYLSFFFFVIERQRELFVIISTIREYRYYPPFLERKKLSQLFVNPRERHFSRLRGTV